MIGLFLWLQCAFGARLVERNDIIDPLPSNCIGTGDACYGNECCEGYPGSLNKSFPCPTADVTATTCESDIKYDLFNASLMNFGNVLYDRLSANTQDNDGAAVFGAVLYLGGEPVDLRVQAVDASGNQISLSGDEFKAIKPLDNGRILRFDFHGMSSAMMRFHFGHLGQDGGWTPLVMPWATITLMDFDCGRLLDKCEEVLSFDHTYYEIGSQIGVEVSDGVTKFEDMLISNAENNPTGIDLDDEQKSISVSLFFEETDNFTLSLANYARWPRSLLLAGITTMQWEGLEMPAPTPAPTSLPTPSPTQPPATPTPSPTPAPTCPLILTSGNCAVDCDCISSPHFPGNYGPDEHCVIEVQFATTLHVKEFFTEVLLDSLQVDDQLFSGHTGPDDVAVEVGSQISWVSDGANQETGWHICATVPTPMPTSSPTPSPTSAILVLEGPCYNDATCVYSPNYPSDYGSNQACAIQAQMELTLHVSTFATENAFDLFKVGNAVYSGMVGPDMVTVDTGSVITWSTDYSTNHQGWMICSQEVEPPAPEPTQAPQTEPTIITSAIGDPHVSSITGETFDLWRTGWSTFVQIPQHLEEISAKLLVRGEVRPYARDPCAPAFLDQVHINGSWLRDNEITVHAGSIESSLPFHITINGGAPLFLDTDGGTTFMNESGSSIRGWIAAEDDLWGTDARVQLNAGDAQVDIVQRTEGRGEESNSMLDLSVSGLAVVLDTVGGWLGLDGSQHAGQAPPECQYAG